MWLVEKVVALASKETIINCFASQQPVYLASDGGAIPG
jgi:hypothetical protein